MSTHSHEQVAEAWISVQENWWAYQHLQSLIENSPEEAWDMILAILERIESPELLEDLGAGPLEDLMRDHGPEFIDRVESLARENQRFRAAVSVVDGHLSIDSQVLERLRRAAARGPV